MIGAYNGIELVIHPTAFAAENADLIGDATIGEGSGI